MTPHAGGRLLLARRSDERLVELLRQGDAAAFEVLYDRYHLRILSFCRHMLGSQHDGEDATQHAFVALHRHITADERPVDVKPWLFQVARNRCLSIIRARREHADVDDPILQPATEGLAESVQRRGDLRELLADLQQLPEDQRAALLLSSLGDLTSEEIATVVDCRPQKVKALVFQARTSLMNERDARDTDCQVVREQLATLRGGSLLRGALRRHVRSCEGCRAFRDQSRKQRQALALLLPVIPTAGLKATTMSAALGGAAGAGGAITAATGGGSLIAGLAAGGKASAAKIVVAAVLAGGGIGAGVAEVHHLSTTSTPAGPGKSHHGQTTGGHHTTAPAGAISGAKATSGHSKSHHGHGHGKPSSSPAASENAATGKGIAGTQPRHGAGTTGTAGAPGRLKAKAHHGKAKGRIKSHAHVKTTLKPVPPVHTTPTHTTKPATTPVTPTPTGSVKQQPTTTDPALPVTTAPSIIGHGQLK